MVTRMEGRVDQLESVVGEVQQKQAEVTDRLATIEVSLDQILEQLRRGRRTPSPTLPLRGDNNGDGGAEIPNAHEEREQEKDKTEEEARSDTNRHRKLELPLFDGEDPLGWIFRVERYFAVCGVSHQDKMDTAVVGLEGKAVTWFQWLEARTPVKSWPELKTEIIERFHCKQAGDEYEQLMALRQTGSVTEFREQFELISAPLENASEDVLIGAFMNGLNEEVRCDVKLMHPQGLKQLMNYAGEVEGWNQVRERMKERREGKIIRSSTGTKWVDPKLTLPKFSTWEYQKTTRNQSVSKPTAGLKETEGSKGTPPRTNSSSSSQHSGVVSNYTRRRLPESEINRRRELGLCFRCEEKYGPNHKCKNKQLRIIMMEEGEEVGPDTDEEAQEASDDRDREMASMEISISTAVGLTGSQTLKLGGHLYGEKVSVLIDCGATHNFIATRLIERLKIPTRSVKPYAMTLGGGRRTISNVQCPNVQLNVQGLKIQQDLYPFDLGNMDVVLGVEWLGSLGKTRMNWRQLYMKIRVHGQWKKLVGDPTLSHSHASFKSIKKTIREVGNGYLLEIGVLEE
ncbi:hypothetical protein QN277_012349 [Acacia crassicarpa]|uniref:Retrotransposon gag domain-containing protein n=1 Tax=Acacia crassicarpa TaxID=499986 RepID=A0AAE1N1J6_9FABA|nr:hypothetical protein QN277_012349 [Acacia crassicarpa]